MVSIQFLMIITNLHLKYIFIFMFKKSNQNIIKLFVKKENNLFINKYTTIFKKII